MKHPNERRRSAAAGLALAAVVGLHSAVVTAQPPGPPPARSAREAAPIDLTGQWVSIVTDVEGYNLTPAAAAIANEWDPAKEEAAGNECKAYGAPAIMRVPGRLRISWQDDSTLKIETDAGRQTRLLHFGPAPDAVQPSLQGWSRAEWLPHGAGPGRPPTSGTLEVTTTSLTEGYFRKNGIPYSAAAVLTEYFDLLGEPDGSQWLVVKAIVDDPAYLAVAPITSSNFRKQTDRSGWDPQPCWGR